MSLARGCLKGYDGSHCTNWYKDKRQDPFVDDGGSTDSIKPKRMHFKLRPNKEETITFEAKKKNNPVDMYFLLDLTHSMKETKENLAEITDGLIEVRILSNYTFYQPVFFTVQELRKQTDECQFGYGVFREKPMVPMSKVLTNKSIPSFEHLQDLTTNKNKVKRFINNIFNPYNS